METHISGPWFASLEYRFSQYDKTQLVNDRRVEIWDQPNIQTGVLAITYKLGYSSYEPLK